MAIDYIAKIGCILFAEGTACRARFKERDVLFPNMTPDALRERLNKGMKSAVAHYSRNVASSGVAMDAACVEEAALNVVLHTLYAYNLWRRDYPQHRDQPLVVGPAELAHVQSHDECLHYCERAYGAQYRTYAAALVGMSDEEFVRYEDGRRRFWER
jgi:hypothetical protein